MELFATFNEQGEPLGLVPRNEVHAHGLWHRSAHIFLFDRDGRLLLQQRAPDKDLYANMWDYSVGEHLKPDEDAYLGALRGLAEELGVPDIELTPLGDERWVEYRGDGFVDREIQQAFRCEYQGEFVIDPIEVAQVKYVDLSELAGWITAQPGDFTPWFIKDLYEFGFL